MTFEGKTPRETRFTDAELREKVFEELDALKINYPKKNTVSFKSQSMLEKIRWLENVLGISHVSVTDLVI